MKFAVIAALVATSQAVKINSLAQVADVEDGASECCGYCNPGYDCPSCPCVDCYVDVKCPCNDEVYCDQYDTNLYDSVQESDYNSAFGGNYGGLDGDALITYAKNGINSQQQVVKQVYPDLLKKTVQVENGSGKGDYKDRSDLAKTRDMQFEVNGDIEIKEYSEGALCTDGLKQYARCGQKELDGITRLGDGEACVPSKITCDGKPVLNEDCCGVCYGADKDCSCYP